MRREECTWPIEEEEEEKKQKKRGESERDICADQH